jgi:hypothetical protein
VSSYKKEFTTETGWSDWLSPEDLSDYKISRCDCGLVHVFQLRPIIKVVDGQTFTMHELVVSDQKPNEIISVAIRAKRENSANVSITSNGHGKDKSRDAELETV